MTAQTLPLSDLAIEPTMLALKDCLCEQLTAAPPCFCGIVPGALVAADYVDCGSGSGCGMAWVRLDSLYPSVQFPNPAAGTGTCATPLAARIEMGVIRCAPVTDARGEPPGESAQQQATDRQLADAMAMYRAIICCQTGTSRRRLSVGAYTPIGPDGGYAGGRWLLTVPVE
jgi:hypothetical protein